LARNSFKLFHLLLRWRKY